MTRPRRIIFGCGYLGSRVARRWLDRGDEVFAVTRRQERARELQRLGVVPLVGDVTNPATLKELPRAETILYAVGHDRSSSQTIDEVYAGGVVNVLSALVEAPHRFVYVSTTGVYGDAGGGWVDEETPPAPARPGGRASLSAEEALRASPLADRAAVLRMGGLYGPGRLPFLDKLRAGEPIPAPREGWLNLIHIDDAAAVAVAAADAYGEGSLPPTARLLNVVDGHPIRRAEYYRETARLLGVPPPTFAPPDPQSHRAARARTNRRVSNARLLAMLPVRMTFPNAEHGLAAILSASDDSDPGS